MLSCIDTHPELVILRPQSSTSCHKYLLLLASIVDKHWPLTICSLSVQFYRKVVVNTTQLTLQGASLRQFPRLSYWNFYEKPGSSIWYKWSSIPYNSSLESVHNWCNFELSSSHNWTIQYLFVHKLCAAVRDPYLYRTNMSCRTCVVVKEMQSNPISWVQYANGGQW